MCAIALIVRHQSIFFHLFRRISSIYSHRSTSSFLLLRALYFEYFLHSLLLKGYVLPFPLGLHRKGCHARGILSTIMMYIFYRGWWEIHFSLCLFFVSSFGFWHNHKRCNKMLLPLFGKVEAHWHQKSVFGLSSLIQIETYFHRAVRYF